MVAVIPRRQLAEPLSHLRASMNSEQLVEAILSDARERSLYVSFVWRLQLCRCPA